MHNSVAIKVTDSELVSCIISLSKRYPIGVKAGALFEKYGGLDACSVKCETCGSFVPRWELKDYNMRPLHVKIGIRLKRLSEQGYLQRVVVQELYKKLQYGYLPCSKLPKNTPDDIKSVYELTS